LFSKLEERYRVPLNMDPETAMQIKIRVCLFIKIWLEKCSEDLKPILNRINDFTNGPVTEDFSAKNKSLISALKKAVDKPLFVSVSENQTPPPKPKIPKNVGSNLTIFDIDPMELARQLTIRLAVPFYKIQASEFFDQNWSKNPEKAPNILATIEIFNQAAAWISSLIVMELKLRDRAKVWECLIKVAQAARELNNFHLLMAIISGLNKSGVSRLKFTKTKMAKRSIEKQEELEGLMNNQSSYKLYREALKTCPLPALPYLGVYLSDLIFIDEGNPSRIGQRINFAKQKYVFNAIEILRQCQSVPYNFVSVPQIQNFMGELSRLGDEALYTVSLKREPRGCTQKDLK